MLDSEPPPPPPGHQDMGFFPALMFAALIFSSSEVLGSCLQLEQVSLLSLEMLGGKGRATFYMGLSHTKESSLEARRLLVLLAGWSKLLSPESVLGKVMHRTTSPALRAEGGVSVYRGTWMTVGTFC